MKLLWYYALQVIYWLDIYVYLEFEHQIHKKNGTYSEKYISKTELSLSPKPNTGPAWTASSNSNQP